MNARQFTWSALQAFFVISTTLFTAHVNAQVTLYDNLDNIPFDVYWLSPLGSDRRYAQQFLAGDNKIIESVTLKLQRTGSGPTGTLGVDLWRDNGSDEPLPVGDANAVITRIGTIDVTQLPEKTFADIEFNGLGLHVEPNTPYWVVTDYSGVRGISGASRSIGWGVAGDEVPPGEPPLPRGYDATLGTHGAAFAHLYSNGAPFWEDATSFFPPAVFYLSMAVEAIPGGLQPGDADQDRDFDQLDLVQVLQAAKYLTSQAATWGEGDWDGAPGGEPGNPPPGDGLFDQIDVIAALGGGKYLTGPYAAVQAGDTIGDSRSSLTYNAGTGELAVDSPADVDLTSINVDSTAGILTGESAQNVEGTFGSSVGSLSFGNVSQAGLSEGFVLEDLTVIGSRAGGGDLGNVDLVYVPEPAAVLLLSLGVVIGLALFRPATR